MLTDAMRSAAGLSWARQARGKLIGSQRVRMSCDHCLRSEAGCTPSGCALGQHKTRGILQRQGRMLGGP